MPELPEVETIRRGLQKVLIGRKIEKFDSRDLKVIQFEAKDVEGLFVTNIERRAKILIFYLSRNFIPTYHSVIPAKVGDARSGAGIQEQAILDPRVKPEDDKSFSNNKILLCHLKMTGQLIWEENPGTIDFILRKKRSPSTPFDTAQSRSLGATTQRVVGGHPSPDWVAKLPNAYTRAIISFDDKSVLFFNDLRRFGYMKLYDVNVIQAKDIIPELKKLGPEPFSSDFNFEYLMRKAAKIPNRKIKQFITDQEIISGVGNIYVDEALFYAGILPTRSVKEIKLSEWKKIIQSITKALDLGLKYGGSSEETYVDAFGNQGTMGDHTRVYRKTEQPCQVCGTRIERITLGGRGTHFCPKCQK